MKNIMMNKEMAKAILDGRKSQTRRVVKEWEIICKECCERVDREYNDCTCGVYNGTEVNIISKPTYEKGEVIWVREPARILNYWTVDGRSDVVPTDIEALYEYEYIADREKVVANFLDIKKWQEVEWDNIPKWFKNKQGIPNGCIKEMARIFLKITDVRVGRLQDTTFEDIFKEGFPNGTIKDFFITTKYKEKITLDNGNGLDLITTWWIDLWNKTASNGYKWDDNPYVFVYEFERVNKDGSDYE